jgi:hypothetical protein
MSSNPNNYEKPNDIFIYEVTMTSDIGGDTSLLRQVKHISIYEDVTSTCIRGELSFTDGQNIMAHFPICGQERIKIRFVTPGLGLDPTTYELDVVEILERTKSDNGKSELIKLGLISPQARLNKLTRISKTFRGKTSAIASSIFRNHLRIDKPIAIEPTSNSIAYCSPSKNPIEIIQWLACKAVSGETNLGSYNYLFFENANSFVFASLDSLSSVNPTLTLKMGKPTPISSNPSKPPDLLGRINEFENIDMVKGFNRLQEMSDGLYSSKLILHDLTFKSIKEVENNFYTDYYKTKHIEEYPTLPIKLNKYANSKDSKKIVRYKQSAYLDGKNTSQDYDKYLQKRNTSMLEYDINKFEVTIAGNSKITVGIPINLEISKPEPAYADTVNSIDEDQSGKYLVTAVRHMIDVGSKPVYKNIVQLSRGASPRRLPDAATFEGRKGAPSPVPSISGIIDFFKGLF